jgi:hypothetical protein
VVTRVEDDNGGSPPSLVPRPDPTDLTTAQLNREIARVEEATDDSFENLREYIVTRLEAQAREHQVYTETDEASRRVLRDKAEADLAAVRDRLDAAITCADDAGVARHEFVRAEVDHLCVLTAQRFDAEDRRADLLSRLYDERRDNQKEALTAALAAADRAVAKTEERTDKQIEAIRALIDGAVRPLTDQLAALTSRFERQVGTAAGSVVGADQALLIEQRRQDREDKAEDRAQAREDRADAREDVAEKRRQDREDRIAGAKAESRRTMLVVAGIAATLFTAIATIVVTIAVFG